MATLWTLGCDADDPHRIAAFWAVLRRVIVGPAGPTVSPTMAA